MEYFESMIWTQRTLSSFLIVIEYSTYVKHCHQATQKTNPLGSYLLKKKEAKNENLQEKKYKYNINMLCI